MKLMIPTIAACAVMLLGPPVGLISAAWMELSLVGIAVVMVWMGWEMCKEKP